MDETKMMEFVGRAVGDVGAVLGGAMVVIGDKLGLYRSMAGAGSLTPAELAARTGTAERYVREWLSAQAARGYVSYDGAGDGDGLFSLPDEHAVPLTDETSPACVIGAFEIAIGSVYATDTIAERFRTGDGFAWGAHDEHVLGGCERFFRPGYLNHLASAWIPALDGVEAKLAARRPDRRRRLRSRGIDAAARRDLSRRRPSSGSTPTTVRSTRPASARPKPDWRIGCASRSRRPRRSRAPTTWCASSTASTTWATPRARARTCATTSHPTGRSCSSSRSRNDDLADNLNPVGAAYYGFSTLLCTPSSLSQEVGTALGAQAGEARLREDRHRRPASRLCAASRKRRSTSCSKRRRDHEVRANLDVLREEDL